MYKLLKRLALTGVAIAMTSTAIAETNLRLATIAPADSVWDKMLGLYVARVEELSEGDLTIEVFPNAQLGNMADTMSQTLRGRIDIWTGPSPVIASLAADVLPINLPFQFDSDAQIECVMPQLDEPIRAALGEKGMYLATFPVGYNSMSNKSDFRVPDDIAGQKIKSSQSPISNALVKAYGGNPVPLNPVETASALSTGLVDGGDSALAFWFSTGQIQAAPYFLRTRHYFNSSGMIVGPRTWSGLTEQQQQILMDATDVLDFGMLQGMLTAFEEKVLAGAAQKGATVTEPTEEERNAWKERGLAIWDPILAEAGEGAIAFNDMLQELKAECGN